MIKFSIMKKIITILTALALMLSIASCRKKDGNNAVSPTAAPSVTTSDNMAGDSKGEVKVGYKVVGEDLIFTINCKVPLETDAWVGICSKGSFLYENDADEAEFSYGYYEERETNSDEYVFKVSFSDLDDGEYTIVFCNSDNSGYVIASWGLKISGSKASIDFSGFKVNAKPADINETESPVSPVDDPDDDPESGDAEDTGTDSDDDDDQEDHDDPGGPDEQEEDE